MFKRRNDVIVLLAVADDVFIYKEDHKNTWKCCTQQYYYADPFENSKAVLFISTFSVANKTDSVLFLY